MIPSPFSSTASIAWKLFTCVLKKSSPRGAPSRLETALMNATVEEQQVLAEAFTLIGRLGQRAIDLLRSEAANVMAYDDVSRAPQ